MVAGCTAILGILFILLVSFAASKKWLAVLAVIPLMIVPIFHIIGNFISHSIGSVFLLDFWIIYIIIDILGLVLSCLILGLISLKFKFIRLRILFLSITGIYCVILFFILISDTLAPFIM